MFVNRMRFYGVKALRTDIPEKGELTEAARKRVLFHGANGTGKSTVLHGISALWKLFGEWIDVGTGGRIDPTWTRDPLAEAEIAAIELREFSPEYETLWIGIAKGNAWEDLRKQYPASQFAGMVTYGRSGKGEPKFVLELPKLDLSTTRSQMLVGKVAKPNVVYFPPEERMLNSSRSSRARLVNLQDYRWSAEYDSTVDLDGLLTTVKAYDEPRYLRTLDLVNGLLRNQRKKLSLPGQGKRHAVEISTAIDVPIPPHSVDLLSSGEKQIVLMVAFASCLLQEGGILIADEPDLHLHAAMVKPLIGTLYQLTQERHGQLIVAAHSTTMKSWFVSESEQIQLSPFRGGSGT